MKILVFSDSHGRGERMRKIIEKSDVDAILFLGDGMSDFDRIVSNYKGKAMLASVKGNCDLFDGTPEEKILTLGGMRILMLHGHTRGVKYDTAALEGFGMRSEADIILYGHTHTPDNRYIGGGRRPFYIFNPGSIGSYEATFGYIEILDGKAVLNVAEYEEK